MNRRTVSLMSAVVILTQIYIPVNAQTQWYSQNFAEVTNAAEVSVSENAQEYFSIKTDEIRGGYLSFDFTDSEQNSRGGYMDFAGVDVNTEDKYVVEFDASLTPGDNQPSCLAIKSTDFVYYNDNINYGLDYGYIFSLICEGGSEIYTINGTESVTIPSGEWCHYKLYCDKTQGRITATITGEQENILADNIVTEYSGQGNVSGLYMLAGRYNAVQSVDNIVVRAAIDNDAFGYVEPETLASVQFEEYPNKIIQNPSEGEGADYPITIKATGSYGNDLSDKVTVDWSVYGLENQEGNVTFTSDGISANLNVTCGIRDYFGYVAATVSYNGEVKVITTPFAIIASTESPYILPKAGYPVDMKDYPDSLVGYEVQARGLNNPDMILGNLYYGSNAYMTAKLVDTEDGIRALELARNGGSGSSVILYDWTPMTDNYVIEFVAKGNLTAVCMNNRYSSVNYQWHVSTDNNVLTVGNQTMEDIEISSDKWYRYIVTVNPAEYTFTVHTSEMTDEGYVTVSQITAKAQGGYDCRNVLISTSDTMYLKSFKAYLQGDEIVTSPEPVMNIEVRENGKVNVQVNTSSPDGIVMLAAYTDSGELYSVQAADNLYWNDFTYEALPENVKTFKAIWWDDIDGMKPIVDSVSTVIE